MSLSHTDAPQRISIASPIALIYLVMPELSSKSLESWIWDAACSIRGAKDAPLPSAATIRVDPTTPIKDYILPLICTKRLSEV